MRINRAARTLSLKIVYYGAGMCGKSTNLVHLHARYADAQRGELIRLDTETERTLFFDYFPIDFGTAGGQKVKIEFFTVPGQSFYSATRQAVLEGVDGIVFVADSDPAREAANELSHADMLATLASQGRDPSHIPTVYQWNKRDLRRALPVATLERSLNRRQLPSVEAIASEGIGVWETQTRIVRLVMDRLSAGTVRAAEVAHHA